MAVGKREQKIRTRTDRLFCLAGSALVAVALATSTARAADSWSRPFHGVRYLYRTTSRPWRIHALVIDLCAAGVSARATTSSEKKRTASSFGKLVAAEMAINGDFFSYSTYNPGGLAVGKSHAWGGKDSASRGVLGFGLDRAEFDGPNRTLSSRPSWVEQAVSGYPYIVVDGKVPTSFKRTDCAYRHPRTAGGLSRDRQTLYLAVVDGRSSLSIGMTCAELGKLMAGLGAHFAVNLDGGGSSTMWIKGKGVVNRPSDGYERTVANHLAIQANGSGRPRSCDNTVDELTLQADVYGASTISDIDGDGKADACARGNAGWRCHLSKGSSFGTRATGPALSDSKGWGDPSNYGTLRMGDINGDGKADLCARANAGIRCWLSTGSGFGKAIAGPPLSDAKGWSKLRYASTIRLADIDGDGKDDLCARSAADFRCYPSTGSSFKKAIVGPKLADAKGWGDPSNYGTIRMGDIDGDGKADLCARSNAGIRCWRSRGTAFRSAIAGPAWSNANGWSHIRYWSTIRLADVDGDGKADICGRSASDFRCVLSRGSSFATKAVVGPKLANAKGWADYDNYSTIRLADIDGDHDLDLCARANAGIRCWPWRKSDFGSAITGPALSDKSGYDAAKYFRTIRYADINADGKRDLCARGKSGLGCWLSKGTGFGKRISGPAWSDALSWGKDRYYATIHVGGPRCRKQKEICDRKDNDCDGKIDEGAVCSTDGGARPAADGAASPSGDGAPPFGDSDGSYGSPGGDDAAARHGVQGGCGCGLSQSPSPPPASLLLLIFVLLALRRAVRRRDRGG